MAAGKFYTQEQIELAKMALNELPDLTPQRITRDDMLEALSGDIHVLHSQKGYSAADIRSELSKAGITVSERSIQAVLRKGNKSKGQQSKSQRKKSPQSAGSATQ